MFCFINTVISTEIGRPNNNNHEFNKFKFILAVLCLGDNCMLPYEFKFENTALALTCLGSGFFQTGLQNSMHLWITSIIKVNL